MPSTESEVAALLARQSAAIGARDLDALIGLYSPDIVYFDVVPPLRYAGTAALRDRFAHWFAGFEGPVTVEVRDRRVEAGTDLAMASWFNRVSGTLTTGRQVGSWVRATSCLRRGSGGWSIIHEHISLPVDMATGAPALQLQP